MAKKKTTNAKEDNFFEDLKNITGGTILSEMNQNIYYIDTGNLALNFACSGRFITGGIPGGRITEVYGPPASSKSLLGNSILGACQRIGGIAILLDCERASNPEFARSAGHLDIDKILVYEPTTIEEVESKIINVTKAIRKHKGDDIPICYVWDSIGVTPSEREFKEIELPEGFSEADFKRIVGSKEKPGERARAAGDLLRKVNPFLNSQNATMFVINQVRSNIGVMYGSPEVTAGGGKALEFYASCRLRTSAAKMIEDKKRKVPLGVNLKFKNKKSRSAAPGMEVSDVQLYFAAGINPIGGLLSALIAAGRIEPSTSGKFKVNEPWANGEEIVIKTTMAKNDVPLEYLYQCPSLIDAKTEKEVRDYLEPFAEAIALFYGEDTVEIAVEETE